MLRCFSFVFMRGLGLFIELIGQSLEIGTPGIGALFGGVDLELEL